MFGVDSTEFLVVAVVALLVIGPKDLPVVLRKVGGWVGRARAVARHFRSGIDTMIRESELDEMETRWKQENDRVMREHPMPEHSGPDHSGPDHPGADGTAMPMTDPGLMPPPGEPHQRMPTADREGGRA